MSKVGVSRTITPTWLFSDNFTPSTDSLNFVIRHSWFDILPLNKQTGNRFRQRLITKVFL
jgi:hypothetical protein